MSGWKKSGFYVTAKVSGDWWFRALEASKCEKLPAVILFLCHCRALASKDGKREPSKVFRLRWRRLEAFRISRHTVRRALVDLEAAGLLEVVRNSTHTLRVRFQNFKSTPKSVSERSPAYSARAMKDHDNIDFRQFALKVDNAGA